MDENTFDLKGFRENCLKMTQAEFASLLGMRQDAISRLERDPHQITLSTLLLIASKTGMTPDALISYKKPMPKPLETVRTWGGAQYVKDIMSDYLETSAPEGYDPKYDQLFIQLKALLSNSIRKPKFVFLGRSDSGKSTMINALIGKEKMPTSWTPTTSIVVYIKHIEDRPSFIKDELWIFRKGKNGELWDDSLLSEDKAEECRGWKLAGGNAEMLASYGTRKGENYSQDDVGAAVMFVDSDILLNCDLLDVPGFTGGIESDNVTARKAQVKADALIYLAQASGFFNSTEDFAYLKDGINILPVLEKKGENNVPPLVNLFVVATQAHVPDGGNPNEINRIRVDGCKRFYDNLTPSFWNSRKAVSGYEYTVEDFSARFFAYTTDIEDLRKPFEENLASFIELMPTLIRDQAINIIKAHCFEAGSFVKKDIAQLEDILTRFDENVQTLNTLLKNEPTRKFDAMQKRDSLLGKIKTHKSKSYADFQEKYKNILSEEHIISVIDRKKYNSKKDDMQLLCAYINSEMEDSFKAVLTDEAKLFSKAVEDYIKDFSQSCNAGSVHVSSSGAEHFNAKRAFASGLTGAATLGGLAFWASTLGNLGGYILVAKGVSVLSALGISIAGGTATAISAVSALGGPVVLGVALALVAAIGMFGIFSSGWKKKAAKKIREAYSEQNASGQYSQAIDKFWSDTENSFRAASDKMESDWQSHIADLRHTIEYFDKDAVEKRIRKSEEVKVFFNNLPL